MFFPIYRIGNPVSATLCLLDELNVKVCSSSVNETLQNHPDYPAILSISDSLKQWKIDNWVIQADKDKLLELPVPFIAHDHTNNMFITVKKITNTNVTFCSKNKNLLNKPLSQFLEEWSGVMLFAEAREDSGEKNYKQSRKNEFLTWFRLLLVTGVIIVFVFNVAIYQIIDHSTTFSTFISFVMLKFFGSIVTILLLLYQVDAFNPIFKEICGKVNIGQQNNCDIVLNSKHAKPFNLVTWSEIGFFYFFGGFVSLIGAGDKVQQILAVLGWLNVLAFPYTIFSLYYQWKVAKSWCALCVTVQAILIIEFIINQTSHHLFQSLFAYQSLTDLLSTFSITLSIILPSFILTTISWFWLKPLLLQSQAAKRKNSELFKFKYDSRIFKALLAKQKQLAVDTEGLGITIGNKNATNTIIKVCNPYCGPCGKAHSEIDTLLEMNTDLKVQIIFTATNNEIDKTSFPVKHLLEIAETGDEVLIKQALKDWYESGYKDYHAFALKYPIKNNLRNYGIKVEAMDKWCTKTKIDFTPTFFINLHQLPELYHIKDLKYFLSSNAI